MKDKVTEYLSAPIIDLLASKPQFITKKGSKHHSINDCSAEIQQLIKRRRENALESKVVSGTAQQEADTKSGEACGEGREQNIEGNGR